MVCRLVWLANNARTDLGCESMASSLTIGKATSTDVQPVLKIVKKLNVIVMKF